MDDSDKLKSRKWQKKRLEILNRDSFMCRHCSVDNDSQLHVHHLYYDDGKAPWDYPNTAYLTLCDKCHKEEHEREEISQKLILRWLKRAGFSNKSVCWIADGLSQVKELPSTELLVASSIYHMFASTETFNETYNHFKDERI